MAIGKKRHRITIQSPAAVDSGAGSYDPWETNSVPGWTTVLTCWSEIEALQPRDPIFNSQAMTMQVSHMITIRYPGRNYQIGAGYQILYTVGGITRVFSVLSGIVNPGERNIELQMLAWENSPVQGGLSNAG